MKKVKEKEKMVELNGKRKGTFEEINKKRKTSKKE